MKRLVGSLIVMAAVSCSAFAGSVVAAPEIDASTGTAALTLISGGMLILRSRRNKTR